MAKKDDEPKEYIIDRIVDHKKKKGEMGRLRSCTEALIAYEKKLREKKDKDREKNSQGERIAQVKRPKAPPTQRSPKRSIPDDESDDAPKRTKHSNGTKEDHADVEALKKYSKFESWEDRIVSIEAVEHQGEGVQSGLRYAVQWQDDSTGWVPDKLIHAKAPQIVIKFLTSHLKWKPSTGDD